MRKRSVNLLWMILFVIFLSQFIGCASEWQKAGFTSNEADEWYNTRCSNTPLQYKANYFTDPNWAKQWKDAGFSPKDTFNWYCLTGITDPNQAKQWRDVGFSPGLCSPVHNSQACNWLKSGFKDPNQAAAWKDAGFDSEEASEWSLSGFKDPNQAMAWKQAGFPARKAIEGNDQFPRPANVVNWENYAISWKQAGFTPRKAKQWKYAGLTLDDAQKWKQAGFTSSEALVWINAKFTLEEAQKYKNEGLSFTAATQKRTEDEWKQAGFSLSVAKQWIDAGFTPDDAKSWKQAGFTSSEAKQWMNASGNDTGFTPEEAKKWKRLKYTPEKAWNRWQQIRPDHMKDVAIYREGNGYITYFSLVNVSEHYVSASGTVTIEVGINSGGYNSSYLYQPVKITSFKVIKGSFKWRTIGIGSFERPALIVSKYLSKDQILSATDGSAFYGWYLSTLYGANTGNVGGAVRFIFKDSNGGTITGQADFPE